MARSCSFINCGSPLKHCSNKSLAGKFTFLLHIIQQLISSELFIRRFPVVERLIFCRAFFIMAKLLIKSAVCKCLIYFYRHYKSLWLQCDNTNQRKCVDEMKMFSKVRLTFPEFELWALLQLWKWVSLKTQSDLDRTCIEADNNSKEWWSVSSGTWLWLGFNSKMSDFTL